MELIELIQACKEGDEVAWNALIHRYQPVLYWYAYSFCRNREEAEDIVSQVLLSLYRHLRCYRAESNFTTWLFRIVRNTYLDRCVRSKSRPEISLDTGLTGAYELPNGYDIPDPDPTPETQALALQNESTQEIARAIRHLPAYQRQAIDLYYVQSRSYEEIGEETGLSVGAVKSRLHRARKMLRKRLEICR